MNKLLCYKSCEKEWIIVMKIIESTKTNDIRPNIVNRLFAKYRANKLQVVEIKNKYDDRQLNEIENICYCGEKIKYTVGKNVEDKDYFSKRNNHICKTQLDYFLCEICAYYYEIRDDYQGKYISWYDNGQKMMECTFKNKKYDGKYEEWYDNCIKKIECEYMNGILNGQFIKWYKNGIEWRKCTYKNGEYHRKYEEWWEDGKKCREYMFMDGENMSIDKPTCAIQ